MILDSSSAPATEAIGHALARRLALGTVVALYGDLGTGKTVFARGIARGLGIDEPVTSPTFTIVQEYRVDESLWFYHLDLYRIGDVDEALAFGIEDFLFAPDAIAAVEWPERITPLLQMPAQSTRGSANKGKADTDGSIPPGTVVTVHIEHAGPTRRRIVLPDEFSGTIGRLAPHVSPKGCE